MANLTVSDELLETLQRLARIERLSVNQLTESVLSSYTARRKAEIDQEIAETLEAVAIIEARGNRPYTQAEIDEMNSGGVYYPDPQELAELLEAVAEDEADEAAGIQITMEEIKQMTAQMIAEHKHKKAQGAA